MSKKHDKGLRIRLAAVIVTMFLTLLLGLASIYAGTFYSGYTSSPFIMLTIGFAGATIFLVLELLDYTE